MTQREPVATILTSGIGLGIYIPALLIQYQLKEKGCLAEVKVLEEYYTTEKLAAHIKHRKACHANFALAQLAHRMAKGVQDCLDENRINNLLEQWQTAQRKHFIVWSGFWLPVLEAYRKLTKFSDIVIDHCRIDAEISASFKVHSDLDTDKIDKDSQSKNHRNIWLWNGKEQRLENELAVTQEKPLTYAERNERIVLHGGGWGLGTYQERAKEMLTTNYGLDVVVHNPAEINERRSVDRFFMVDPNWNPWVRKVSNDLIQPPVAELVENARPVYKTNPAFHEFYKIIRRCKAIVSKPGGCTLIDSLSSCTPLVILEPYGYAEESNGRIWEHLGFGISYAIWAASGFSESLLEQLHDNLINRKKRATPYVKQYASLLKR